ncbi:MAG: 4Fe-4S binding protein [Nitrospirae bacterium]|nr:4Fe-4S binding protein [Nitrospirota bacterium]
MLKDRVINQISNDTDIIRINQSRCLRMRFNKNSCNKCREACHAGAITISEGVIIDRNVCSGCMLCVPACPSDCFEIATLDFYSIIAGLRKIQSPVLGCNVRSDLKAHEKTFCLGFLSGEHIIALLAFMQEPLQINLTLCADCRNGSIVDAIRKRLDIIGTRIVSDAFDKIRLVKDKADLDFQEVSYDRRDFFMAMKNLTFMQAARLFGNETAKDDIRAYSAKKLPLKRELLNRSLNVFRGEIYKELLKNYYYTITVNRSCNGCFACIGMCPTGALKIGNIGNDRGLFFNSSLCSGCGLCENFCTNNSICIERGFSGGDLFEFNLCYSEPFTCQAV